MLDGIVSKPLFYNSEEYKFHFRGNDFSGNGAIDEIINNDEYFLSKFTNLKGNIIDIGANNGLATIILSKQNPQATIYSFEPNIELIKIIQLNIESNNLNNVKLFNLAVTGPDKKTIELVLNDWMSGANSTHSKIEQFNEHWRTTTKKHVVECISLDEIIESNGITSIDFLKIDCEGAEYEILYNSNHFKNNIVKNMVGEFHDLTYLEVEHNAHTLKNYCRGYVDYFYNISILRNM